MLITPDGEYFQRLRETEFSRLDASRIVYVDYTGAALYPESLVTRHAERLKRGVFGNPHSENGPSLASTAQLQQARQGTLALLDADPDIYEVIFTANATAGVKILGESFPFQSGSHLLLTADNHNSVNGLRASARRAGATVRYVPLADDLAVVDPEAFFGRARDVALFAYPAQSNFSGVQHPLRWVAQAQQCGYRVLLDAASYLPSHRLSLREHPADFVVLSFYKLFGYPTGVGALVLRREALRLLRRSYFSGGSVEYVSIQSDIERLKSDAEAFEDGTIDFLAMSAVSDGLDWFNKVTPERIHEHVIDLRERFMVELTRLNGRVICYGPESTSASGVLTFNLLRNGAVIPYEEIEGAARQRGIALRGGCFCNPGASEVAFGMPEEASRACMLEPEFSIAKLRRLVGDSTPVGALRVSFGPANNRDDVRTLVEFIASVYEKSRAN